MSQDYAARLSIGMIGDANTKFYSTRGVLLAEGYTRVVIGHRGPYVEFQERHIKWEQFELVADPHHWYFAEYRSYEDQVKLYHQLQLVRYADYRIGLNYISPFEMVVGGSLVIEKLRK